MTLGELRRELAWRLGLDATTSDGLVGYWDTQLLNDAARDIATLFLIPRVETTYNKATIEAGPIGLPSNLEELLRVVIPPDRVVPVLEADDYIADPDGDYSIPLQRKGAPALFILNSRTTPQTLTYVGSQWDEPPPVVKIIYKPAYTPMSAETDQPWLGQFARFHSAIAALAAQRALLSLDPGEQETAMRYKAAVDDYNRLTQELRNAVDRLMIIGTNSMAPYMYERRKRWGSI